MELRSRVDAAIDEIRTQALRDGIFSKDESRLIDLIQWEITELVQHMQNFEREGTITDEIVKEFDEMKTRVAGNVWKLAKTDARITPDEEGVISALVSLLDELQLEKS